MTKLEYLAALEKALKSKGVGDCADILEEYDAHFDLKIADGYGEAEIAARLGPPGEIAAEFGEIGSERDTRAGRKIILAIGLFFAVIFAGSLLFILYAWVFVLGVFSLACAVAGVMAVTGQGVAFGMVLIPPMPYISALLLGIALLALAMLAYMGMEYCRLYTTQLFRVYARWHKAIWNGSARKMPPVQKHPAIAAKKRRMMRSVTLVSLMAFMITFIVGLGSMMLAAGSFEPWHVWNWFR